MKADLIQQGNNKVLVVDGIPKKCPFQQTMLVPAVQKASLELSQQPSFAINHNPCGDWCALFILNKDNFGLNNSAVELKCVSSNVKYHLDIK